MKFWDSSAVTPLLVDERSSGYYERIATQDPAIAVWFFTKTEVRGALERKKRDDEVAGEAVADAKALLGRYAAAWKEVDDFVDVREMAGQLLARHRLSASDALQLAAALVEAKRHPRGRGFVVVDEGLAEAAAAEGFTIFRAPERRRRRR